MSFKEVVGDIWSYLDTHTIVIPTNRLGVMGAGLALQAKQKFPHIQESYQKALSTLDDKGAPWYSDEFPHLILAPTKRHWKDKSNTKDLNKLLWDLSCLKGGPFAMPEMGCGLGGLTWAGTCDLYRVFREHFSGPISTEWIVVHPVKIYTGILR